MWIIGAVGVLGLLSWCFAGNSLTSVAITRLVNLFSPDVPSILRGPLLDFVLSLAILLSKQIKTFFQGLVLGHIPWLQGAFGRLVFKGVNLAIALLLLFSVYMQFVPRNSPSHSLSDFGPGERVALRSHATADKSSDLTYVLSSAWLAAFLFFLYRSLPDHAKQLPDGKTDGPDLEWYAFPPHPCIAIVHRNVPWRHDSEVFEIIAPWDQHYSQLDSGTPSAADANAHPKGEPPTSQANPRKIFFKNAAIVKKPAHASVYHIALGKDLCPTFSTQLQLGSFKLNLRTSLSVASDISKIELRTLDARLLTEPEASMTKYQAQLDRLLNDDRAAIQKSLAIPDGLIEFLYALGKFQKKGHAHSFYETGAKALEQISKFEKQVSLLFHEKSKQHRICGNMIVVETSLEKIEVDEDRWKAVYKNFEILDRAMSLGQQMDQSLRNDALAAAEFIRSALAAFPGVPPADLVKPLSESIRRFADSVSKRFSGSAGNNDKPDLTGDSSEDENEDDIEDDPKDGDDANQPREVNEQLLAEAMNELEGMIGLKPVKDQVEKLVNHIKLNSARESHGLKVVSVTHHVVFLGPPGSGKTEVARIMGKIYRALGLVSKGQVIETDREGMVGGYIGQSAIKTAKLLQKARGGVLFIDEAYDLHRADTPNDFGSEAVATLLKRMEDWRKSLVVIAAGYEVEMLNFLHNANPGLDSRFPNRIKFYHYSNDDLIRIFRKMAADLENLVDAGCDQKLSRLIDSARERDGRKFGNGRFIRTMFERTTMRQGNRLVPKSQFTLEALKQILPQDIPDSIDEEVPA